MSADVPALIKAGVLCAALSLLFCSGAESGPEPKGTPTVGDPWDRALALAIEHTPRAKGALREMAAAPPSPVVGKLAAVLLEEWSLPVTDETLRKPRLVYLPEIDLKGLPESHGFPPPIVINATVDARGLVRDAAVDNRKSDDPWARRALDQLSHARFRPARDARGYIARPYQFLAAPHP